MSRLPEQVYEEFVARRAGILRALTTDVDAFFADCDPEKDNLCLYGHSDCSWQVDLPADEVPPEIPEPALGINFARDGMQRKDWLSLVAVHSDSWLLALAFFKGAKLDKDQREKLFYLINALPTCYEVVSGKHKAAAAYVAPVEAAAPQPRKRNTDAAAGRTQQRPRVDDAAAAAEDDGWQDGEGDPCPGCRDLYRTDVFWIECDRCKVWWCGRCAKMTEAKAEKIPVWHCMKCA